MLDSPIEEIKSKVGIVELLADYVQLKKAGTNYKAVCPFHNEKTPSFMVSPSKQIWHCFGCGLGGDVFEFVKQMENVEFGEALKILADRAGIELKKPTVQDIRLKEDKEVLYEINELASEYFCKVLWESQAAEEALEYLRGRGLNDQTIKKWKLGWAPDDFHYLENFLSKNFGKTEIEEAGLIIKKDDGSYFDRFHGRIMFPIVNEAGKTAGFTGRLLKEKENTGKYINSPETAVYNKSRIIYGFYHAKNSIRKDDRAVIVEGNLDVISSHQAGFTQTVASSGTAFTEDQLATLHRLTTNLVFAFDSDNAGVMAADRTLQIALRLGFNVKIINITGAKDPDELIKKGIGIWQKHIDGADSYMDFMMNEVVKNSDPSKPEGIQKIEEKIIPLISYINNRVIKAHYVRKLAELLSVNEKTIFDELNKIGKPQITLVEDDKTKPKKSRLRWLQERVLGLIIRLKDKAVLSQFEASDFSPYEKVYISIDTTTPSPELTSIFDLLEFSAQTDVEEQELDAKAELKNAAMELNRLLLKQRMEKVTSELKSAEQKKDQELVKKLSSEYVSLTNKIGQLKS